MYAKASARVSWRRFRLEDFALPVWDVLVGGFGENHRLLFSLMKGQQGNLPVSHYLINFVLWIKHVMWHFETTQRVFSSPAHPLPHPLPLSTYSSWHSHTCPTTLTTGEKLLSTPTSTWRPKLVGEGLINANLRFTCKVAQVDKNC